MARTARQTASILTELYDESFANDSIEQYRIMWNDLRGIAGVEKLSPGYLRIINRSLCRSGYLLITLDNYLVVTQESDLDNIRLVPPRIVEQYRYEEEDDDLELDDEDEESEVENSDDCEISNEDVESV
ncbi:MAG: hypothetical protein J0665_09480 [Deltaproteobacteria bacterium]|nr:hypothetical protein [Deltaproteobacteria bacterium]